ncbi:hypothetical protein A0256_24110 [Mucilaginibacter sp. PAMC 26640]|nr:hypothetical protein A0256_24110 [Mucilaginibacter sp. PAMC 26640]
MNELDRTNNNLWKWGIIYYNPNDAKLLVTKRSGLGWTFNFAHKGSWFFMLALVIIVVAVSVWK